MSRVVVNEIQAKVGNDISFNDAAKIDTLKGKTTAGSITVHGEGTATTNLQQGLCKAFINGGDDASIRNSLNISTNTDVQQGQYEYGFTNAFTTEVDAHCSIAGMAGGGARTPRIVSADTSASVMRIIVYNNAGSATDSEHYVQLSGDLA